MDLTTLLITYNEEPNLARVLDKLTWAPKILIIDSGSTDTTLQIASSYQNVEVVYRGFDTFAQQCNFGMGLIQSKWVLSLDADYVLTEEFINETKQFILNDTFSGYATGFKFCVFGKPLKRNNTTPRVVLFQAQKGHYVDDGHAHRLELDGAVKSYQSFILHDDRKDLTRWFLNQNSYSIRETTKLLSKNNNELRFTDKIRKLKWAAPIFVFFHCLFIKGLILDGWHGWHYTLQRTLVEIMFCLRLIEEEKIKSPLRK